MKDPNELKWMRVFSPVHIPRYLVEQVKQREFTVDDFYKYQELHCLIQGKDGPTLNPLNHLYVLSDEENIVKGFLWFVINPLTNDMIINTFSIDDDYWWKGKAVKMLSEFVKKLMKKLKLKKVYWITNYPKHSERHGFKRSKSVLMEYMEEEDGERNDMAGRPTTNGECKHADPGAGEAL